MNKDQAARRRPFASGAAILGKNPKFWQYIELVEDGVTVRHPDDALDWIYATFEISSRTELDDNPEKAAAWGNMIGDFNEYLATGFQAIPKPTTWSCPELLAIARLAPCMRCGNGQGQGRVVGCHAQGFWATKYGKGWSKKPSDFVVAFLCDKCHRIMDAYENADDDMVRALEWAALIFKTYEWLFIHGFLIPVNAYTDANTPPRKPPGGEPVEQQKQCFTGNKNHKPEVPA